MRATLLGIVLVAACHGGSGGGWLSYRECKETGARGAIAAAPAKPPPAVDDFGRLLAYRNYYSLDHVGTFEHHFAIWFQCIEPSVSYFAISPEGEVREAGGWWGGMAVHDDAAPPAIPDDQAANAKLAMAAHERAYDGAAGEQIEYLGSYREVTLGELVPDDGPGDPYQRMIWHQGMTVRADAELTTFDGTADLTGGYTKMCWADSTYTDCGPHHWIDFVPASGVGRPQLAALLTAKDSPQPAEERARFAALAMAAARGEPGVPIDTLLAEQGTSFLPPGYDVPIVVSFTIFARWGKGVEQTDGALSTRLAAADVVHGTAKATDRTRIAGVTFTVEVAASLAADEKSVRIAYTIRDDRKNERTGEVDAPATLWNDGDAVAFRFLSMPEASNDHLHDPPFAQHFPGSQGHDSIDLYLGVGAAPEPWYP